MKVARTVLSGGKAGDNLKGLPIAIKRTGKIYDGRYTQVFSKELFQQRYATDHYKALGELAKETRA